MTNNNSNTALATKGGAIERLQKTATKGSLAELAQASRRSLLLVDCSGSMDGRIRSGLRKIDALRNVVKDLRETHPVPVAAFGFNRSPQVRVVDVVPEPEGGTPIHDAIDFGRVEGATHLVLVTDGQPDSESRAFSAARAFGHPIDVFYIGDGNDFGADFAQRLAAATGGTANITDLGAPKQLTTAIAGLLGDGGGL